MGKVNASINGMGPSKESVVTHSKKCFIRNSSLFN